MKHTVTLIHSAQGWLAKHSDPYIKDLFGTDTVPMPYTASAESWYVLDRTRAALPDSDVLLVPSAVTELALCAFALEQCAREFERLGCPSLAKQVAARAATANEVLADACTPFSALSSVSR